MTLTWIWIVDSPAARDTRADRALLSALEEKRGHWEPTPEALPELTRSRLQNLIADGKIIANGKPIKPSDKFQEGTEIRLTLPAPRELNLIPEDRPLEFLYEDEHLVVINKPPGLTVHPSSTQTEGTLVHALLHHIKDLSGIGGALRPGIVHRIDKDTSGALVVTKTDAAHQKLVETFSRHDIERRYWALCYGALKERGEIRIESLIGRHPSDRKKMSMHVRTGRKAITHAQTLETYSNKDSIFASLIEARLETGRTHQVRVHLTNQNTSLLGDPVYGTPTSRNSKWLALPSEIREAVEALPGQALHARVLGFAHPITGKPLRFEAGPPPAFAQLLEKLRHYPGK